ncbi:hypothetical protein UCDDA912_g09798 [Diaporthe ampelina]|uniref:Uncharacterized protein n=1 Tax=Diaporthe ampelina TaxID=1214573 RepID=A0A0G2F6C1_9PEZI|nr:hypothetical protein UCDDA912_g09798 [Diaporthe ampelina]
MSLKELSASAGPDNVVRKLFRKGSAISSRLGGSRKATGPGSAAGSEREHRPSFGGSDVAENSWAGKDGTGEDLLGKSFDSINSSPSIGTKSKGGRWFSMGKKKEKASLEIERERSADAETPTAEEQPAMQLSATELSETCYSINGHNGRRIITIGRRLGLNVDRATADALAQPTAPIRITRGATFAACALGRTFSVPFACREPHRVMNACMKAHATPQEEDAAREDWFARRQERARERQEKERRKAEQQRFMREWWGLEESEREEQLRRAAEEKLTRAERVGGFASGTRRRFEGESEKKQ